MDRPAAWRALAIDLEEERPFRIGGAAIDPVSRDAELADGRERLQPQTLKVLIALVRRKGEVVTRSELIDSCWNGRIVGEDVINHSISLLRDFAERAGGFSIETVPKTGYRIVETGKSAIGSRSKWLAAAAVAAVVVAGLVLVNRPDQLAMPAAPTIAVLPFKDYSDRQDFLAEGLTEEVSTRLAEQTSLRVAGRSSSALFANAKAVDAGKALNVRYLVEGSVRRQGDDVRVNVGLVDTKTGIHLWSRAYNGPATDLFGIQTEIGNDVAEHLGARLQPPIGAGYRPKSEAYALYLTAKGLLNERQAAKNEAALDLLRRAVKLDANYAAAWARLAEAKRLVRIDREGEYPVQASPFGEEFGLARRALSIVPEGAEPHAVYAMIRYFDRESIPYLEKATQLEPSNSEFWYWLFIARQQAGDFPGAIMAGLKAAELDPFWEYNDNITLLAWNAGLRDKAKLIDQRIATSHPEEIHRAMARSRLADRAGDYSAGYQHKKRALFVARPDDRGWPTSQMAATFFTLGLPDQAARAEPIPSAFLAMARGKEPAVADLAAIFSSRDSFWLADEMPRLAARSWINAGHGERLLLFYDHAFRSTDEYRSRFRNSPEDFVYYVPLIAQALRAKGRAAESQALLRIGLSACSKTLARPPAPMGYSARCAMLMASTGQGDSGLAMLKKVVDQGWKPDIASARLSLASEPALSSLRTDRRLLLLDRHIAADLDRERQETLALL